MEQNEKPKIFLAVPVGLEKESVIDFHLVNWIAAMSARPNVTFHPCTAVRPIEIARNKIVEAFLQSDAEWLCMIDADMIPTRRLFEILDSPPADASVITAKYHMRLWNLPPVLCWHPIGKIDENGWQELEVCGAGTLFVRRSAFEKLHKPFFKRSIAPDGLAVSMTEDIHFCVAVRQAGMRIYGNRNFECGHLKTFDVSQMKIPGMPELDMSVPWHSLANGAQIDPASFAKMFNGSTWVPAKRSNAPGNLAAPDGARTSGLVTITSAEIKIGR